MGQQVKDDFVHTLVYILKDYLYYMQMEDNFVHTFVYILKDYLQTIDGG